MDNSDMPPAAMDHMDHSAAGHPMAFSTNFAGLTLLFQGWTSMNAWQYALTLIFIFLFAVFGESLAYASRRLDHHVTVSISGNIKTAEPVPIAMRTRAERSALYGLRTAVHFMLMLASMTFDVGIFITMMAGFTIGFFIFSSHVVGTTEPCHEHA